MHPGDIFSLVIIVFIHYNYSAVFSFSNLPLLLSYILTSLRAALTPYKVGSGYRLSKV